MQNNRTGNALSVEEFLKQRKWSLEERKVLIVGVGGLGCELLKCFVSFGFKQIHIIDMDTIEITNLNRQFFFRHADVGKSKALAAAEYVKSHCQYENLQITPHFSPIEEKDAAFYKQFDVVVSGLDSIEARRWLNDMLHSLLVRDKISGAIEAESIVPLIDGGTEGLKGSVRVIIPGITACFECTIGLFPQQTKLPLCTLTNNPRKFSHCIEYAAISTWPEAHPDKSVDNESLIHLEWIRKESEKRATEFGIQILPENNNTKYVQLILKNIIPAVSSTNALIASICCNEVVKMSVEYGRTLNNYFLYNGTEGIYSNSFECEKLANCSVCSLTQLIRN